MKPHLLAPAALRVIAPPLFAVRHVEAALQVAYGRVQIERAERSAAEQAERDYKRAMTYVRVKP